MRSLPFAPQSGLGRLSAWQALHDTHRLALLDEALYFPDGQIKGEVYVYGSFIQSPTRWSLRTAVLPLALPPAYLVLQNFLLFAGTAYPNAGLVFMPAKRRRGMIGISVSVSMHGSNNGICALISHYNSAYIR
jgi:hypothetical protein